MKFSGKMCFKIILKFTKNQSSTLSIEDTFVKKTKGGWGGINLTSFICKDVSFWPVDSSDSYLPQDVQIANVNVMKSENNYGIQNLIDISRFTDYSKLLRITAYM